jgi:hypothetical protein
MDHTGIDGDFARERATARPPDLGASEFERRERKEVARAQGRQLPQPHRLVDVPVQRSWRARDDAEIAEDIDREAGLGLIVLVEAPNRDDFEIVMMCEWRLARLFLRRVTRSRDYALDEPVVIEANDFFEIAMACHLFASDVATKLPKTEGAGTAAAPGSRHAPER